MTLVKTRNNNHDVMYPAFSNLVENLFGDLAKTNGEYFRSVPAVNIAESKDDFQFEIAAPGMDKKDFTIDVDNNVLSISASKEYSNEEAEKNFTRREFSYSSFKRAFTLPNSVNVDKIEARYENGLLKLVVPKREEVKPRQIKIS
jgi:HSP20 family protein